MLPIPFLHQCCQNNKTSLTGTLQRVFSNIGDGFGCFCLRAFLTSSLILWTPTHRSEVKIFRAELTLPCIIRFAKIFAWSLDTCWQDDLMRSWMILTFTTSVIQPPFQVDSLSSSFLVWFLALPLRVGFWRRGDGSIMYTFNAMDLILQVTVKMFKTCEFPYQHFGCISRKKLEKVFSPLHYLIVNSTDGFNKFMSILTVSSRL